MLTSAISGFILFISFLIGYLYYDIQYNINSSKEINHAKGGIRTSFDLNFFVSYSDKVKGFGYEFDIHKVMTEDGYILTLFRIYKKSVVDSRKVVLINHGLLDNSFTFFALGKDECLPFILANNGLSL